MRGCGEATLNGTGRVAVDLAAVVRGAVVACLGSAEDVAGAVAIERIWLARERGNARVTAEEQADTDSLILCCSLW